MDFKLDSVIEDRHSSMQLDKTSAPAPLSSVFSARNNGYINEYNLFVSCFNAIPNFISEKAIDCQKADRWFRENYRDLIKENYFHKWCYLDGKEAQVADQFYFLYEDLIVNFDFKYSFVRFLFRKTDINKVEEIIKKIRACKKSKAIPEISLLVNNNTRIDTVDMKITRSKLNIHDNYNDDFSEIHKRIVKRLSKKNDKGIILLHGKPGTGKTSYIRHLITTIKKRVVFLPPNMASAVTNPNLISVLMENPNSIFVIEDAENIVVDRERDGNSPVSALLNISDGLLSDCLNIQIICSFNTDLSKVDSALLRKGRLIAKYEFKELEVEKAQALSDKLGFSKRITEPTTLTSIYNQNEKEFTQAKSKTGIGFKTNNI